MLRLAHMVKTFGGTRAVDDVSLEVRRGEIVALAGENGAGKTTLMRIAAGEIHPDSGTVDAAGAVELVHQHFMLVSELTIAENLALTHRGFRFLGRRSVIREAEAAIESSGIDLPDVSRHVGDLSVGEKSKLELIKAISRKPATLVLDEPTSVLTPSESRELFAVMRRLAERGTAVVFISHKLAEVMEIAERIVVMRAGKIVAEKERSETTAPELADAMMWSGGLQAAGSRFGGLKAAGYRFGGLKAAAPRHPNITAIVGVAGNGQTELAAKLRNAHPEAGHIPEDRTRDGIVAEMTIAENLALRGLQNAPAIIDRYSIRAHGPRQRAGSLSGGNQQKVVLARELDRHPKIIVAAEPTRGLDLAATAFVHEQLRSAADAGAKVTLITSDLDEAFALASTIQVIYRGQLSEAMTADEAAPRLANLMAGLA